MLSRVMKPTGSLVFIFSFFFLFFSPALFFSSFTAWFANMATRSGVSTSSELTAEPFESSFSFFFSLSFDFPNYITMKSEARYQRKKMLMER